MMGDLFNRNRQETEEHWVSISDVMIGLMVIFLFIAIGYMLNVRLEADQMILLRAELQKLVDAYKNWQVDLARDLETEFEGSFAKKNQFRMWKGYLDKETLSIRFKQPFPIGVDDVPGNFANKVLQNFFPRYIAILAQDKYRDRIAEIRIEGHTSSEWSSQVPVREAYIKNMELSQNRSRNVLDYVLNIEAPQITANKVWIKKHLTANGLSSSQLILNLERNCPTPANSYLTIAEETGIQAWRISQLHQRICSEIRTWENSETITQADVIKAVLPAYPEFRHKVEVLERAMHLLTEDKTDDKAESRRVEFRVVTKAEKLTEEITQLMAEFDVARETGIPLEDVKKLHRWIRNTISDNPEITIDNIINSLRSVPDFSEVKGDLGKAVNLLIENPDKTEASD